MTTDKEPADRQASRPLAPADAARLQQRIKGRGLAAGTPDFEAAATAVWNQLGPVPRRPDVIVQVADEQDVVAAILFAREHGQKVAVRGGGHNWSNAALRRGGMLIDLTRLNKVISIDPAARRAVVQPIISNRDLQARVNAQQLAFPSGHCPTVKLSGYLLSGGMAWNQGVWGPGVASVEAIELVTAAGELIVADHTQNPDYFWAARGAGPGFFGVATRYHLKLHPLPQAIACSTAYYPIREAPALARWLEALAPSLPRNIELSLFLVAAPPAVAAQCGPADAGKVCLVTATIFAATMTEAREGLAPLEACPVMDRCLAKTVAEPNTFQSLFDASGALWPAGQRCHVEAMFSNAPLADIFDAVTGHFLDTPSPTTVLMFAIETGPTVAPTPADAAFSMSARYYGGPWTMWSEAGDDVANTQWHDLCLTHLKPFAAGHYIAESDTVTFPRHVRESYTPSAWARLEALRQTCDPDGLFYGYYDGLR